MNPTWSSRYLLQGLLLHSLVASLMSSSHSEEASTWLHDLLSFRSQVFLSHLCSDVLFVFLRVLGGCIVFSLFIVSFFKDFHLLVGPELVVSLVLDEVVLHLAAGDHPLRITSIFKSFLLACLRGQFTLLLPCRDRSADGDALVVRPLQFCRTILRRNLVRFGF